MTRKCCYNKEDHRLHLRRKPRLDSDATEILVVRGGQRAYLWVKSSEGNVAVSGVATLRKVAHAILAEVKSRKGRVHRV